MHYPDQPETKSDTDSKMFTLGELLIELSGKVMELNVTAVCAKFIVENIELFKPVLKSVSKLNINLYNGPLHSITSIKTLIGHLRMHSLSCVRFVSYKIKLNPKDLHGVFESVYKKEKIVFDADDFINLDSESYKPKRKQSKIEATEDEDLYECAFESFNARPEVGTEVTDIHLVLPSNDTYETVFLPVLQVWRNLTNLILEYMIIGKENFIILCKNLKRSLKALTLNKFDCAEHEQAILDLPRFNEEATSKLEKLSLHRCTLGDKFFTKLLDETDVGTSLRSLNITIELLSTDLIDGFSKNFTLQHLYLNYHSISCENSFGRFRMIASGIL